jgi:hypothetical protein
MSITFSRDLIRGKIAEVIFEQMIRDEGRYTVIPFGYEHTMPMLAQYQHLVKIKHVIDKIKGAPDFALISADKSEVYLVEVKYQAKDNIARIKKHAINLLARWDPSWIFVATPRGFYCGPCSAVARGRLAKLSPRWVESKRQERYLALLNEFRCQT